MAVVVRRAVRERGGVDAGTPHKAQIHDASPQIVVWMSRTTENLQLGIKIECGNRVAKVVILQCNAVKNRVTCDLVLGWQADEVLTVDVVCFAEAVVCMGEERDESRRENGWAARRWATVFTPSPRAGLICPHLRRRGRVGAATVAGCWHWGLELGLGGPLLPPQVSHSHFGEAGTLAC